MSDASVSLEDLRSEREITRLVHNYCHGIDRRDLKLFLSIWTDDAVYTTNSAFGDYVGRSEIERGVTEAMWSAFKATHHWTVNLVVDLDGDSARSISNLTAQCVLNSGVATVTAATYHDEFRRDAGQWLMSKRVIELHHFSDLPGVDWDSPSAYAG
jgi:ketosteroid isomerase-like protein